MTTSLQDPLALTRALVRIASPTPAGRDIFNLVEGWLEGLGFACERHRVEDGDPPFDNLFARFGTQPPLFCFSGHLDTVPVGDEGLWTHPPLAATIADGRLYGRGSVDMKSGVACFVAACAGFLARHQPRGSIGFLISGDEEAPASRGMHGLLESLSQRGIAPDLCLTGEPTSCERTGDTFKTGRRGSLTLRLEVDGRSGHTGYPQAARNAAHDLITLLGGLLATPLDDGMEGFEPSHMQVVALDVPDPASNVIPGAATAVINARFNPLHDGGSLTETLRQRLRACGEQNWRLVVLSTSEPFVTHAGALSAQLGEAITDVTGLTARASTEGGTSDSRFIRPVCPVVDFGLVNHGMHAVDESVAVDDLDVLTRIYARLLEIIVGSA